MHTLAAFDSYSSNLPHVSGSGSIKFANVNGKTIVQTAVAKSPLRLLTPQNDGLAAWVYMSTYGGGIVDADTIDVDVDIGAQSSGVLLSQSATKVYKSKCGCSQSVEATIHEGAVLFSLPDPIVCFKDAKFLQTQTYNLATDASLLLVETFHSGRHASDERWAFNSYRSQIEVFRNLRPLIRESLLLDARAGWLDKRLGRYNAFSTLFFVGAKFDHFGREIIASLAAQKPSLRADFVVSANALAREGVVVRMAAVETEAITDNLKRYLQFVPKMLGDDPWQRKW